MPTGLTPAQIVEWNKPRNAAQRRLDALRDTMRMEMPDAASDVINGPVAFSWGSVPEPAKHLIYATNPPTGDHDAAQCLYMIVSMGSPEAMEQFRQSEIGTVDGRPCFVDGWGRPIMFLRWAPGYSGCTDPDFVTATGTTYTGPSQIQSGVAQPYPRLNPDGTQAVDANGNPIIIQGDHDPFDTRNIDWYAFKMVPLIYSAGPDGQYDINLTAGYVFAGNPYQEMSLGQPADIAGDGLNHHDNITNHAMDQR
jgi:hypothetical protein